MSFLKNEKVIGVAIGFGVFAFGYILGAGRHSGEVETTVDSAIDRTVSTASFIESASSGIENAQGEITGAISKVDGAVSELDESTRIIERLSGSVEESGAGLERAIAIAREIEAGLRAIQDGN